MKKKYLKPLLVSGIAILSVTLILNKKLNSENKKDTLLSQRKKLESFVKNSPYKETLKWDKKKRKLNGLPPNRYFEQMWELTINPSTGKLDDGSLTKLREELKTKRLARKNPGNATNAWEERGPNDVGGRTRVMLFDPNDANANTVFAGGVSGGLWKNTNITNANSQWSRVQNVPGNLAVTSISVDPRNSNRWYVGTGEQYTAGDVVGNGVYVTTDGGNSWNALIIPASGPDSFDFNASNLFLKGVYYVNDVLAWDNGTNTELFVAVGASVYGDSGNPRNWLGLQSSGIYRSADGGTNWSRIESTNLTYDFSGTTYYYTPNDFEVAADNKIWMGTIGSPLGDAGGRVFSSSNGATWTEATASPLTESNRVELAVSSTNANKMYALTQGTTAAAPVHVYGTTNGFATVTTKALPNDADNGISAADFTRGQAFYDLMIEVNPTNDNILYVGGIDLFRSTNSASGWTQISKWSNNPGLNTLNTPFVHADQHAMTFRPGNTNQAVFGNDGGIFYASSLSGASNSSNAISVRNNNYNVTQYVKAGIGPNGNGDTAGIFTAGAQDNGSQAFRNAIAGINGSEELSDGDGFYTFVDKDGQYMTATFTNNVIYRFNLPWNGLGRRQGGATTLSNDQTTGDFVNPMDYDSNANRLLTNGSAGANLAIKSFNVAANSNGTLTNAALTAKPTAFRASPFVNNTWYVGLENGGLIRLTGVTNTTATWSTVTTPFVGAVSTIRFGATANDIFVTMHNYGVISVWATSNGGTSWTSKEGNLPNIPVRDFLQNPLTRNEAIIATQLGVWATTNFNNANPTWTQSYNGMSDVSVTSLDYWAVNGDDNNNKIIASTYGRGVFTGKFTSSNAQDTEAPSTPNSLTSTSNTDTSVSLTWTASTDNIAVTSYDILNNNTVIGNTVDNSFTVNNLTPNSVYSFSIRAKDQAGNTSNVSNTLTVTTNTTAIDYCSSQSSNTNDEFISNVTLGSINNNSGAQFYSDFTGISTTLTKGNSYTITITPTWTGTNYNEGYAAWIDFNKDGDFTDAGEQIASITPSQNTTVSSTFTIPTNTLETSTRMRVSMSYNAIPTACQSFTYGEVEDYVINIENTPLDTTAPIISLNGATIVDINVNDSYNDLGATASDNADGNLTSSIIKTGTVNTNIAGTYTLNYNVSDVAGNKASQISRTVNVNEVITSGCSNGINTFPYSEGFEGNIGNWSQSSSDDINWSVKTNGTPSNGTGPSSANQGSSYIFVEASGNNTGYPTKQAILTSPCFNLTNLNAASFNFNYHMFGATNMGSIAVDISTDDGANWTNIWNQTGNKGNQWLLASIDLSSYLNSNIKLRFNRITGSTWQADIAIDNVTLTNAAATTVNNLNTFQLGTKLNAFNVYPNPAKDALNIELVTNGANSYKILNVLGQTIKTGKLTTNTIKVSELKTGVYILQINDGEETLLKKFVKK